MPSQSEEWNRMEEIFAEAAALAPAGRPAFLARACGGQDNLRAEIESLLAYDPEQPPIWLMRLAAPPRMLSRSPIRSDAALGNTGRLL